MQKPFQPTLRSSVSNYLVVEGIINSGNDSTIIKLSHTVNLGDSVGTRTENGAALTVEGNGGTWPLTEIQPGVYSAPHLNLTNAKNYHLRIRLQNGNEYLSADEEAKVTPPVDTVTYNIKSNGLVINASAHDPLNNTHYYRWAYDETWLFHSRFISNYKVDGANVVRRTLDDDIFTCFGNHASSTVTVASSTSLAADVIKDAPITNVSSTSEKLGIRYSINIKQYALSKNEFNFWENLKKNTESLGSIFDALPSQLTGNIHSTSNPTEPVIGYVGVSTVTQKRIFINNEQLPQDWKLIYPADCGQDTALYVNRMGGNDVAAYLLSKIEAPTSAILGAQGQVIGFFRSSFICVDCTLRGTKRRPDFWIDK